MKQSNVTKILHETSLSATARFLLAFLFTTDNTTINIDKLVSGTGLRRRAITDAIAELKRKNMASAQKMSVGNCCIITCYSFIVCAFLSLRQICHHDKNIITTKISSRQKYHHDKFVITTKTQQRVPRADLVRCFVSAGPSGQNAEISKASAVIDGDINEATFHQSCNITITIDVRKHSGQKMTVRPASDIAGIPETEAPLERKCPDSDQVPQTAPSTPNALEVREAKFRERLSRDFSSKYSMPMLDAFADYWTEHSPGGKRMRYEMQATFDMARRLGTWARRENSRTYTTSRRSLPVGFILQEDDMKPFHGMKDEDFFK